MGIENEIWKWELKMKFENGNWDWKMGIRNRNEMSGLKSVRGGNCDSMGKVITWN